jgi:hypothetical protein
VSAEALLLAVSTVIRPTSAAAVVAMLATPRPQRLLAAYVLVGMVWSLIVGTLVVVLLAGIGSATESSAERPVLDTVLGVAALGYAVAAWTGVLPRHRAGGPPSRTAGMRRRLHNLSPSGAALAGVLTHLPGLVYLAALNAIASSATGTLDSLVQVVIYNAIWFSVAITALVVSVHRPRVSRDLLERITVWAREHQRVLIVVFCGVLGTYLVTSGVVGLLDTSA